MYRCHAGLIDFVYPVYVGTYHVANIYGGQVVLDDDEQNLTAHAELKPYVTHHGEYMGRYFPIVKTLNPYLDLGPLRSVCPCLTDISRDRLLTGAMATVKKTPQELERYVILLRDIADLLSARATEKATLQVLEKVETETSEMSSLQEGLQRYLDAAKKLIDFSDGLVVFLRPGEPQPVLCTTGELSMEEVCRRLTPAALQQLLQGAITGSRLEIAADLLRNSRGADSSWIPLLIPMGVREHVTGFWLIAHRLPAPDALLDRARDLLRTFVARATSFAESSNQITILSDAQGRIAAAATDPDEDALPLAVTEGAARLYGSGSRAGLWLYNYSRDELDHQDLPGDPFSETSPIPCREKDGSPASLSGQAIITRRPQWELVSSPLHYYQEKAESSGFVAMLSIPLLVDERVVGVLNVHQKDAARPNPRQLAILEAYGRSVAYAVQTWQLERFGKDLAGCQVMGDIEAKLKGHVAEIVNSSLGCVWAYRSQLERYTVEAVWGYDRLKMEEHPPEPMGCTERLRRKRCPEFEPKADAENTRQIIFDHKVVSWAGFPLIAGDKFCGALYLDFTQPVQWGKATQLFLTAYAARLAAVLDRIVQADAFHNEELLATRGLAATFSQHSVVSALATIENSIEIFAANHADAAEAIQRSVDRIRGRRKGDARRSPTDRQLLFSEFDLLELVVGKWQCVEEAGDVEVHWERGEFPKCMLTWPRQLLAEAVEIVLLNAFQAIGQATKKDPKRQDAPKIKVRVARLGEDVWLRVWNSHSEFPRAVLTALTRGDRPPHARGEGMGLQYARGVLRRAGGSLHVRNVDSGAEVLFRIPVKCAADAFVVRDT